MMLVLGLLKHVSFFYAKVLFNLLEWTWALRWKQHPSMRLECISLTVLICSLLVGSELDMWYASFLTNQFKCCNIQFVIFMTFLDPPVSQFFLDIAMSSLDPFSRHPDHYWLKYNLHTIKFIQVSLSKQQFCKQMRKLFTKECNWSW